MSALDATERADLEGMKGVLEIADRVARGRSSVLVLGETGAGKEWLARRIHDRSGRGGPFVAVNCAAIPDGLAESELFGHVRGAFTGAVRNRRGHFELADLGTLFLDEVADLTQSTQVRLLRALQDRVVQPVGSEQHVPVDVRVIAATNRSLADAVHRGDFRKDLYYRIAVVTLDVPPLRDRPGDIRDLAEHWVAELAAELGRPTPRIDASAWACLLGYTWPGNIRELMNVLERASLLDVDGVISEDDLPVSVIDAVGGGAIVETVPHERLPYDVARSAALSSFEVRYLSELLEYVKGRVGEAARVSGMSPRSLYNKMRQYGLRKEDFRP